MGTKTKVVILCSNRLLRESIARILGKKNDFEVVGARPVACSADVDASGADVLVLDSLESMLEGVSGLAVPPWTSVKCVLVAMEDDHSRFLSAVRNGVLGYVLQDASAGDLVAAVRAVAAGEAVCPEGYARVLFDYVAQRGEQLPSKQEREDWGLTRREQQLIPLIGEGLSNKEIANSLNLSEQTVKNHIHRILRKVGVPDRLSVLDVFKSKFAYSSTKNSQYSS